MFKQSVLSTTYKNLVKPILFKLDPEYVHDRFSATGEFLANYQLTNALTSSLFSFSHKSLEQNLNGVSFINPIGLAAGFDYDGHMAKVMKSVGFGFNTVGTVTARYYEGNQKPRLGRLPKSKSLLVNKGFKSEGADGVLSRLDNMDINNQALGISVGSSNLPEVDTTQKATDDYMYTFEAFKNSDYVKYFELNTSCPNITFKDSFLTIEPFTRLVDAVSELNLQKPLFVKMPNEKPFDQMIPLIDYATEKGIRGFIFSNLVKDRANPGLDKEELELFKDKKGNFSGKPTENNANNLIKAAYKRYERDITIVGCSGVFSAHDAYKKIKSGASLVQMITGMIYEGPQVIGQINKGIVDLIKKDGFDNISDAVGSNNLRH